MTDDERGYSMQVKVLIENTAPEGLVSEHGLSFWITYRGHHYLLDSGSTEVFLENARKLGIPLERTECCLLSHGHYDHSGGFHQFFEQYGERPLYGMETVTKAYYSTSGGKVHEIGVPKILFQDYGKCLIPVTKLTEITEGVYLLPHECNHLEWIGERAGLYRMEGEQLLPDDFVHEMSVVFRTEQGLVVFNSCSHGGLLQIMREVQGAFPGERIHAFLGGLHMKGKKDGEEICIFSEAEVQALADGLRDILNVGGGPKDWKIYTGHCTGGPAFHLLKKYLGEQLEPLTTGGEIILGV